MPAIMDDPASPTIHRVTGALPLPDPNKPALPPTVQPRQVVLRDRQTVATVVPFASRDQVPASLLRYLSDQFAKEIEGGDTYPMVDPMPLDSFSRYWFQNFAAIMVLGKLDGPGDVLGADADRDWSADCLGSFYIKPNYPGRSSHVCNAGFLVTDAARNRGVGRQLGESYLAWAPLLGYSYSVFNLVYETNVASCKIWDALGFKRIGRVKGCGQLKSYPDRLVDAIIYGRDLGNAAADAEGAGAGGGGGPVSEERFDKIKFYLKSGRYPNGSDRAEKSRLRSAATHYKLLDNDVLMLKDKEVIADPAAQMDIARRLHEAAGHAGINNTTATIAERYHWSRIKETVSDVIRLCGECKELGKMSTTQGTQAPMASQAAVQRVVSPAPAPQPILPLPTGPQGSVQVNSINNNSSSTTSSSSRLLSFNATHHLPTLPSLQSSAPSSSSTQYANPSDISSLLNPPLHEPLLLNPPEDGTGGGLQQHMQQPSSHPGPMLQDQPRTSTIHSTAILDQPQQQPYHHQHGDGPSSSSHMSRSLLNDDDTYHPIDPQIISQPSPYQHQAHQHHHNNNPFAGAFDPYSLSAHAAVADSHHPAHGMQVGSSAGMHDPYGGGGAHLQPLAQHQGHHQGHQHLGQNTGNQPPHDHLAAFQLPGNDVAGMHMDHHHHHHHQHEQDHEQDQDQDHDQDQDAVDRDLDMLIDDSDMDELTIGGNTISTTNSTSFNNTSFHSTMNNNTINNNITLPAMVSMVSMVPDNRGVGSSNNSKEAGGDAGGGDARPAKRRNWDHVVFDNPGE